MVNNMKLVADRKIALSMPRIYRIISDITCYLAVLKDQDLSENDISDKLWKFYYKYNSDRIFKNEIESQILLLHVIDQRRFKSTRQQCVFDGFCDIIRAELGAVSFNFNQLLPFVKYFDRQLKKYKIVLDKKLTTYINEIKKENLKGRKS